MNQTHHQPQTPEPHTPGPPIAATAIVLARAGSRGLPGKNIRPVAGRPCVAWTIAAAQQAKAIARVIVSSDDHQVLAIARSMNAPVHTRPTALASDTATVDDAARSAAEAAGGAQPDTLWVILYGNVPVRPDGLIDRAVGLLARSGADSVQSFADVGKHHPWWTVRVGDDGRLAPWEGQRLYHGVYRRQALPPAYVPDGGVTAVTGRALMLDIPGVEPGPHAFLGLDRRGVVTRPGEVVDIDDEIDLMVADAALRQRAIGAERAG